MARNDNVVTVIGNLTDTPELRFTPNGAAMARMGLACNRRWMDRNTNEWREETDFFNVVVWRELAENCANSLPKGTRVIVTGRLQQRSWETPQGDRRSTVEIQADEIGPSLRWATASVNKVRRESQDGGGFDQRGPSGGFDQGAGQGAGQSAGQGGGQTPSGGFDQSGGFGEEKVWNDEPPF